MTKEMYENQMALEAKWEREYDALVNEQENIPEDYSDVKITIDNELNTSISVEDLNCSITLDKESNLLDFLSIVESIVVDRDLYINFI